MSPPRLAFRMLARAPTLLTRALLPTCSCRLLALPSRPNFNLIKGSSLAAAAADDSDDSDELLGSVVRQSTPWHVMRGADVRNC